MLLVVGDRSRSRGRGDRPPRRRRAGVRAQGCSDHLCRTSSSSKEVLRRLEACRPLKVVKVRRRRCRTTTEEGSTGGTTTPEDLLLDLGSTSVRRHLNNKASVDHRNSRGSTVRQGEQGVGEGRRRRWAEARCRRSAHHKPSTPEGQATLEDLEGVGDWIRWTPTASDPGASEEVVGQGKERRVGVLGEVVRLEARKEVGGEAIDAFIPTLLVLSAFPHRHLGAQEV